MEGKHLSGNWHVATIDGAGVRIFVQTLAQWAGQVDVQDFNPAHPALNARKVSAGGRQSAWFTRGAYGTGVLRHYRRGGLVARVLKDQYLWRGAQYTRAFCEADILNWMHVRGLPVPRAIAAAVWRRGGWTGVFYRAAIIVEYLPDTTPLAARLHHPQAVAQAIAAMHQAGVWHADLNAFNILLDGAGKVWLIDFDRARRCTMTPARRENNLHRLRRSLVKVAGVEGAAFWEQVYRFYQQAQVM